MSPLQILASFLSFLAGMWAATYLQDRETRRRHLGIIRALAAEVRRVRCDCDALTPELVRAALETERSVLPTLSPWVQGLLSEVATTSPRIVELFLDLERHLYNQRTLGLNQLRFGHLHLQALREHGGPSHRNHESVPTTHQVDPPTVQAKVADAKPRPPLDFSEFSAEGTHDRAIRTLAALDAALKEHESFLAAGPHTHLPWHRPSD